MINFEKAAIAAKQAECEILIQSHKLKNAHNNMEETAKNFLKCQKEIDKIKKELVVLKKGEK